MYHGHLTANWLVRSFIVFTFCAALVGFGGSYAVAQQGNALPTFANRTPAFIDDSFNPVLSGLTAQGLRTLMQPDGKILVTGNFQLANGVLKNSIARYNADGTLDATFNTKSGANGSISTIALQSNG